MRSITPATSPNPSAVPATRSPGARRARPSAARSATPGREPNRKMLAPVFAASSHSVATNTVPDRRTGRGMPFTIDNPSMTPVLSTKLKSQPLR